MGLRTKTRVAWWTLKDLGRAWSRRATAALLRRARIGFVTLIHPDRIGHLALELDSLLKEQRLAGLRRRLVMLHPDNVANPCLLDYWRAYIHVVRSPLLKRWLEPFRTDPRFAVPIEHYAIAMYGTAEAYAIQSAWGLRAPLLTLRSGDRARGRAALRALGVPEGAWFVCVHAREGGYSPKDEHFHRYRNMDVLDFVPAMEEIVAQGGWCVRMGDPSMKRLPDLPGVVDYAHSALKSDWMDVFLCAECRFFLGTSSGLFLVATAFGRPSALVNMVPLAAAYGPGVHDVSIPKLARRRGGAALPFPALLAGPAGQFRFAAEFESAGIELEPNTPGELRELAIEMLERLAGRAAADAVDEDLQARFRGLFTRGHYSHGAASRIGRDFLRRHAALLAPDGCADAGPAPARVAPDRPGG